MVIARGAAWGEPFTGQVSELPVATTDADVARLADSGHSIIAVRGGDLCRTVSGVGRFTTIAPVDLLYLEVERPSGEVERRTVAAHVVCRNRWWTGRLIAVMNAQFIGRFDVAPRSHPNDGRADVLDADLGVADRIKAYRRLPTGAHVPHPAIGERRQSTCDVRLAPALSLWADGEPLGAVVRVTVTVRPDALSIVF
jgi:diacylglycerol kinase family enzyme